MAQYIQIKVKICLFNVRAHVKYTETRVVSYTLYIKKILYDALYTCSSKGEVPYRARDSEAPPPPAPTGAFLPLALLQPREGECLEQAQQLAGRRVHAVGSPLVPQQGLATIGRAHLRYS